MDDKSNAVLVSVTSQPPPPVNTTDLKVKLYPPCKKCHDDKHDTAGEFQLCKFCWNELLQAHKTIPPFYREKVKAGEGKIVEFEDERPFVTILGKAGSGKTISAVRTTRLMCFTYFLEPTFINCAELMMEIRATFRDKSDRTEENIIQDISRVPLLILDDLAAEKVSDYSVSTLYIILNRRGEQSKPTIITSNLTIKEIAEQMGDRIANRLVRYGKVVTLK